MTMRTLTLGKVIVLIACVASCGAANPPPAIVPIKFAASIEGFLGASYKVELTPDGDIMYYRNPRTFTSATGTTRTRIQIPPSRWATFRQRLDAAKVWSWRSEYADQGVSDGTVWHLDVAYSDRKIHSGGRNAFPPMEQFEHFRAAVRELIGDEAFE